MRSVRSAVGWMALVALIAASAAGCTADRPTPSQSPTAGDQDRLARLAADTAEQDAAYRPRVATDAEHIACVSEVFGTEPVDNPRIVYAQLFCGSIPSDGNPAHAEMLITPAAVTLGPEPSVVTPQEDGDWTAAIHKVIPKRWWHAAETGPAHPDALKKQLFDRIAVLTSKYQPSTPTPSQGR
jgi:hypothetical protein